jgi:hypothetical protein
VHIINLDPAADEFAYPVAADIRELISLADVMEEMNLGPNGALLYCMEYLEDSLEDWLSEVGLLGDVASLPDRGCQIAICYKFCTWTDIHTMLAVRLVQLVSELGAIAPVCPSLFFDTLADWTEETPRHGYRRLN